MKHTRKMAIAHDLGDPAPAAFHDFYGDLYHSPHFLRRRIVHKHNALDSYEPLAPVRSPRFTPHTMSEN